jgi:hypothetical protein
LKKLSEIALHRIRFRYVCPVAASDKQHKPNQNMKIYIEKTNSKQFQWAIELNGSFYAGGFTQSYDDAETAASIAAPYPFCSSEVIAS